MAELLYITLFGEKHKFYTDMDLEVAREIASKVVKEVQKIEGKKRDEDFVDKIPVLISAALNIARENVEIANNHEKMLQKLSNWSSRMNHTLDECLLRPRAANKVF